jgi:hypothetical protein
VGSRILLHFVAVFAVVLFVILFVQVSWLGRGVLFFAAVGGVWAMIVIGRLPWGAARAKWLSPINTAYFPIFIATYAFDLPILRYALIGGFIGLGLCIYTRNVRAGRLRLLGIWRLAR